MAADVAASSSPTLLAKMRDYENREAWTRFLGQYEPLIRAWRQRMILLKLGQRMCSFQHDL